MIPRIAPLVLSVLFTIGCSGPQAAERLDEPVEPGQADRQEPVSHFEARPDIDAVIDEAVEFVGTDDYILLLSQDGRHAPVSDYTVELDPRPFTIWVVVPPQIGALVNVSYRPDARNAVIRDQQLPAPLGAPGTGMAEQPFNPDRLLRLDTEMSNYWVYADDDQHRFDDVRLRNGVVVGQRTIDQIREVDQERDKSISELSGNALHIVEFDHRPMEQSPPKRAYTIEFR